MCEVDINLRREQLAMFSGDKSRVKYGSQSLFGPRPMVGQAAVYQESLPWQDAVHSFSKPSTIYIPTNDSWTNFGKRVGSGMVAVEAPCRSGTVSARRSQQKAESWCFEWYWAHPSMPQAKRRRCYRGGQSSTRTFTSQVGTSK